ncbi:MAG: peptide chain release factor-like protein [Bacteroidota bacterium]|nr:peptide chain release factor-like protein [Bacteroidota bacterium]
MIPLPESDEELLAECDVETFRSRGKGGQHANKVETGVRLRHRPSGITVVSRRERSQKRNKEICLARLRVLIARRNAVKPRRIPTTVPPAEREKRRAEKQRRSVLKRLRSTSIDTSDG